MKTKLGLFVAVLAVALFGSGCASSEPTKKASIPAEKPPIANAVKWNGHWYAVLPPANWDAAKQKCEQLGGHLAFAETEAENEFLVKLVHDSHEGDEGLLNAPIKAWLGGTDHKDEGEWVWLNNKPITNFFGRSHLISPITPAPSIILNSHGVKEPWSIPQVDGMILNVRQLMWSSANGNSPLRSGET